MKKWSFYRPLVRTMIWSVLLCGAAYGLILFLSESSIAGGSGMERMLMVAKIAKVIMVAIPTMLFFNSIRKIWKGNTFHQELDGYILSGTYAFILFCCVLFLLLTAPM
ncbi:MAG: hypothetical protein ABI772_12865 [Bacteroidota bacterium]